MCLLLCIGHLSDTFAHQSNNLMFQFMIKNCLQMQFLMSQSRAKMAKEEELRGSMGPESHVFLPLLPFSLLSLSSTFLLSSSLSLFSSFCSSLFPTVSLSQVLWTALVYMASFLLANKLLISILNLNSYLPHWKV